MTDKEKDKLPPTEVILAASIAKAEMCQDIFRHISRDKTLTRIQVLEFILSESEALTLLSQQLLMAIQQEEALRVAAMNKLIADADTDKHDHDIDCATRLGTGDCNCTLQK